MKMLDKLARWLVMAVIVLMMLLCGLAWEEYAHDTRSFASALGRSALLIGLPLWILIAMTLPEGLFRMFRAIARRLYRDGSANP
ncbi:hypothetical protein [Lysobacter sp. CA199]|uniref:hypothetical protein n=1 Tax=Lysobacter sp. CA199 TaxID=3455608 RepID=UPI003F8D3286